VFALLVFLFDPNATHAKIIRIDIIPIIQIVFMVKYFEIVSLIIHFLV